MTAQLIAFKLSDYIYAIIFIGFIVYFISKSERVKNIGMTIFAFGLLFLGIETMGTVMKPLASSPVFTELIGKVADIPILGVAVGALMTLVVQSSSATIAVLQNFAAQPGADGVTSIIGLAGAIRFFSWVITSERRSQHFWQVLVSRRMPEENSTCTLYL